MRLFSSISVQDRVDFAKNLSIMLRSGIAINDALALLEDQSESTQFRNVLRGVRNSIENGNSLSTAFEKEVKTFGSIFVSMIRAGEKSGTLQGNLQFLSDWLGRSADLDREVSAATLYPKMILSAAILLGGGLAVFILPKLVPLFTSMNVELPIITKILLAISLFVQGYWLESILAFVVFIAAVVFINKIKAVRRVFHYAYIHAPFVGSLMRNYQLALITQLFFMLLKSGLSLSETIEAVSQSATNIHYQEALQKARQEIEKGTTLSVSLGTLGILFPKIAISIISVGEKSGTLSDSFEYLAESFTKEVNTQAKKLPTIIEPMLLIVIAGMVGFIALAVIMPIYELTGSISK